MTGLGILCFENGTRYEGEFFEGIKHGLGTMYLDNGIFISGTWINDEIDITKTYYGKMTFGNGDYYIGECLNGVRHGYGIGYFPSIYEGCKWEGEWRNDSAYGVGKLTLEDGSIINNSFKV